MGLIIGGFGAVWDSCCSGDLVIAGSAVSCDASLGFGTNAAVYASDSLLLVSRLSDTTKAFLKPVVDQSRPLFVVW